MMSLWTFAPAPPPRKAAGNMLMTKMAIISHMAVSILFLVQDVSCAPKFSENDFWKIVSTSYEIKKCSGKGRSLNFGAQLPVLTL